MKAQLQCLPLESVENRDVLTQATEVLRNEAAAIAALADRLDIAFVQAVDLLAEAAFPVVVSGVGKSGIIAQKIAATMTSTGNPAVFVHPTDALHGDVGMVRSVAVILSYSGSSREIVELAACLNLHNIPLVAMTGDVASPLALRSVVTLDCSVAREAGPLRLAPTCSTTASLAMGDALALALQTKRGFHRGDFERNHPGGALGKRLTLKVSHVWISTDVPYVSSSDTMQTATVLMANRRGTVPVVDDEARVLGVVTAGDLTRLLQRDPNGLGVPVCEVMSRSPHLCSPTDLGFAVVTRMKEAGVMAMPVVDPTGHLLGIVHLHDLIGAGAV